MSGTRPRLTIHEIAELAGVSVATVSRVINGRGEVSERTREAVQRVVREHGYRAHDTRRSAPEPSGLVGVTLPLIHPTYFSLIVAGIAEALYERDRRVVLCPTQHEHAREVSLLERLMHGTTEGGLLVLPEESSEELRTLLNHGYRFVIVDPREPLDDAIPAVSAANATGATEAVKHLLELGHRRIGAITGPRGSLATEERLRGYGAALAAAGVELDRDLVAEASFHVPAGVASASALLDLPDPPTAIFAFDDPLAIGVLQAARARRVRVPRDLSVVGFDDTLEAQLATPALTTVRQPLAELGRTAVSLLMRFIESPHFEPVHVELATTLVVRESTAAPRG